MTAHVPLRRQPGSGYLYDLPGLTAYEEVLALQVELVAARSQGAIPDTLILCEHEPVVTLGTATDRAAEVPGTLGLPVIDTDRGGRATYHGPGQLVGYPILDLHDHGKDIRDFRQRVERSIVAALADLGVLAEVREGQDYVGVWVGERKIASLGVHVARWITKHGFAVNVDCDLEPFSSFVPCGLHAVEFTSIARELGRPVSRAEATAAIVLRLGEAFGRDFAPLEVAAPA